MLDTDDVDEDILLVDDELELVVLELTELELDDDVVLDTEIEEVEEDELLELELLLDEELLVLELDDVVVVVESLCIVHPVGVFGIGESSLFI